MAGTDAVVGIGIETHRNLCEQKGKKTRPGGPGGKETLTEEETPEISCKMYMAVPSCK